MNINLTQFDVEFRESGFVRFSMNTFEREKIEHYPTYYVISRAEIPLILECIQGLSKFYPFFDDGNYKIRFAPTGMESLEISSNPMGHYWFYMPLAKMQALQDKLTVFHVAPFEETYSLSSIELAQMRYEYRNRIRWVYRNIENGKWENGEYRSWVEYLLIPRVLEDCQKEPGLKDNLKRLSHIAANHSAFGETITVSLSFDDAWFDCQHEEKPASYYFCIQTSEGERILNGGIIAHHNDKDGSYHYSMHT